MLGYELSKRKVRGRFGVDGGDSLLKCSGVWLSEVRVADVRRADEGGLCFELVRLAESLMRMFL